MNEIHVIIVRMSDEDFNMLYEVSMGWAGTDWSAQEGRFVPFHTDDAVKWNYAYAYWFDSWAEVMLGRSFLETLGHAFQILHDEDDYETGYVIVTDYTTRK